MEIQRKTDERFARIEQVLAAHGELLVKHNELIEELREEIREKIGFKAKK